MPKFVLLILLMWNFSTTFSKLPDQIFIETFLSNATTNLIQMETKVRQRATFLNLQVNFCSNNLKASNISSTFTGIFDRFVLKITEVQNMSNHKPPNLPSAMISMYDYTQFCIASLFNDIGNFRLIITNLRTTSTILYGFSKEISLQFQRSYPSMLKLASKRMLVSQILRQILNSIATIRNYSLLLRVHIGNFAKLNTYLSNFIVSNAIPAPPNATSDPHLTSIRSIEAKLVSAQQQIILTAKIARKKVTSVHKTIKGSLNAFSSVAKNLDGISSTNEYSKLGWPIFPVDTMMKNSSTFVMLRSSGSNVTSNLSPRAVFCDLKMKNYDRIEKTSLANETQLAIQREILNATTFIVQSSVKKVQAHPQAIMDVLASLLSVETAQKRYGIKLRAAKTEMKILSENLINSESLGVTTTTIDSATTTIDGGAPTTTLGEAQTSTTAGQVLTTPTAATTTAFKLPTCGTFLRFNPLTDLSLVATYGVLAGTNSDGSPVYVGKGDNSAYLGMTSCPARISVDPLNPGAFMSSSSSEVLDSTTPSFLANHASIVWGLVTEQTAWNYYFGFKMLSGNYPVMIGRKNISGVTYVGRVHYGNGLMGLHIYRPDLKQVVKLEPSDTFEVVGCVITSAQCGVTLGYDHTTNPFGKAITAGVNFDGSMIYPAIADSSVCPPLKTMALNYIGRFTTGQGATVVCHNLTAGYEIKVSGTHMLIQDSAAIAWKSTTVGSAANLASLVSYNDRIQSSAFGRKQMGNWTMFGKVYFAATSTLKGFYGWNTETNSFVKLASTEVIEVMICV